MLWFLTGLPPFPRIHRRGEGCHGVHGPGGAALHLSDHLCGQAEVDHHVRPADPAASCEPRQLNYISEALLLHNTEGDDRNTSINTNI